MCITLGVITLIWVLEKAKCRGAGPAEAARRAAGRLPGRARRHAHAGAEADRRRARARRRRVRPKRHVLAGRRGGRRRRAAGGARGRRRRRRASGSPTRTSTCSWSTSPPGVVVHPGHGHARRARSCRRWPGASPAGRIRSARASCTGSTATRRACSCSPARRRVPPRCRPRCASARITREYLALVEGRPPARAGTIDAPLGRDRRVRTRISTDTDDPHDAITHFETERALPEDDAAAGAPRDGPHAPDPRAPAGDRPPRASATRSTGGRALYGLDRQFLHAERLAFAHPVTGEPIDVRSPLPGDLVRALRQASGERTDQSV